MRYRSFFILLGVVMAGGLAVQAENWPQFRGAAAGVAADDPALPDTWSATQNVAGRSTSRASVELADRVGRSRLRDGRDRHGRRRAARPTSNTSGAPAAAR